jgi:hypothetical protein
VPIFANLGAMIPDGAGGALVVASKPLETVTTIYRSNSTQLPSIVGSVNQMLLGEADTIFVSGTAGIGALKLDGTPLWQLSQQAQLAAALKDGSVLVENGTLTHVDTSGLTTDFVGGIPAANSSYVGNDSWLTNDSLALVISAPGSAIAKTAYPQMGGNRQQQSSAPLHSFGLFWCGTGVGRQGSCPGNDGVVFSYYPYTTQPPPDPSAFYDFGSSHPNWITFVELAAISAYQKAFRNYPIDVRLGTYHTEFSFLGPGGKVRVMDQDFTANVVGNWPLPFSGREDTGCSGRMYYLAFMQDAQTALGRLGHAGENYWVPFTPSYPPATQQDTDAFIGLLRTIGTGIGNGAAHETGHCLSGITPNGGIGLPYLDCGAGKTPTGSGVPCEQNNNFVFNFWSADGQPQDPANPMSNGGQFFYLDQPGAPTIHWGPADDCWLREYANPGSCPQ